MSEIREHRFEKRDRMLSKVLKSCGVFTDSPNYIPTCSKLTEKKRSQWI